MRPWEILITIGLWCHMLRNIQCIDDPVNNYNVDEGATILLECPSILCPTGSRICETASDSENQNAVALYSVWIKGSKSRVMLDAKPSGIFKEKAGHYELFQDGRLKILKVTNEFAGIYRCSVHFVDGTTSRGGVVCLDVLTEGEEPMCVTSTDEEPQALVLETKYIILIAALGGILVLLVPLVFLIHKKKKQRDRRRPMEQPNPSYGHHSDVLQSSRYCADKSQVKSIDQNLFGIKHYHCRGPLPSPPPTEISLNRHFSVDSGVSMGSISGYRSA